MKFSIVKNKNETFSISRSYSSGVAHITPEIASELLSLNVDNRPIRKKQVKKLSKAITNGEWRFTHQGVAVSKTMRLLDGQHRLLAIVDAGVGVDMLVTTGLDDSAFLSIDQHAKRTVADATGLDKRVVAALALAARCLSSGTQSVDDVLNVAPFFQEDIELLMLHAGKISRHFCTAAALLSAAVSMKIFPEDSDYIMNQFRALVHQDYDSMSAYSKAANRRVMSNYGNVSTIRNSEGCLMFLSVYDPSNKNKKRMVLRGDGFAKMKALVGRLTQTANKLI